MKSLIVSIIVLLIAGMCPTTQPAAGELHRELRELKSHLAMLRLPYGSNYPETNEVISLKKRIAELEAAAARGSSTSATAPATQPTGSALLSLKMELAVAKEEFGDKNPEVMLLRPTIARLEAAGGKIDLNGAHALFETLLDRRQHLLKTYGLRHPTVVVLTRKINYLANLLANDPVSDD